MLRVALALNATMFVVGLAAGLHGRSTALVADSMDMLVDAAAYGTALLALERGARFKRRSASVNGVLLALVGLAVLVEAAWHALRGGEPHTALMMGVALLSLAVNVYVLRSLVPYRTGEVSMRATWIFTRADVIANIAVLASGAVIAFTHLAWLDLVVGIGIGLYLFKEAWDVVVQTRHTPSVELAS